MALLDLGMQLWHALVIKWHFAANQHVQHDSETPYVDLWARVLSGLQQLRGRKVQAPTEGL